jgi:hypothetical protein
MPETGTSNTLSCAALPSDAVQIGSVPIYSSSTSPDYVWVTCFGSTIRLKVREDSSSGSVKADDVRFWNSDGQGRYAPQLDSFIDLGKVKLSTLTNPKEKQIATDARDGKSVKNRMVARLTNNSSELDLVDDSVSVGLRVRGDVPCSNGKD